jgi:hypothetical protein
MKKIYKFFYDENNYDTKKAKEWLVQLDNLALIILKVGFWIMAMLWLWSIVESLSPVAISFITGGFVNMTKWMFFGFMYICIWRMLALSMGALIRLVELSEENKQK